VDTHTAAHHTREVGVCDIGKANMISKFYVENKIKKKIIKMVLRFVSLKWLNEDGGGMKRFKEKSITLY
jgi:hypothetical protein